MHYLVRQKKLLSNKKKVCIVGSGHGGAIAAVDLASSGLFHVIVVDIDDISLPISKEISHSLSVINHGSSFNQAVTRGFGFGGSSNFWHGVITKLDDSDWALLDEAAGYSVSSEINNLLPEVCKFFGINAETLSIKKTIKPSDFYSELSINKKFIGKDFWVQTKPLRTREMLINAKNQEYDIEFITNAVAISLQCSKCQENYKAERLVVNIAGIHKTIEADYFILSAGALETPRIILQSIQNNDLPISNKNIGSYLTDHPWTVIGEFVAVKGKLDLNLTDIAYSAGLRYRIGYRQAAVSSTASLGENHCISIKPLFYGEYDDFKESMKEMISSKLSIRSIYKIFRKFKIKNTLASLSLLVSEKFGLGVKVKRALVFSYLEQPSRFESKVSLSEKLDSFGRIIPIINWKLGQEESCVIDIIQKKLKSIFEVSTEYKFLSYDNAEKNLASGAHHAGTMRIGRSLDSGVVDANLKIFNTENIFVCDASVFTNFGNANPSFTLGSFSLRLSRHLQGQIQKDLSISDEFFTPSLAEVS